VQAATVLLDSCSFAAGRLIGLPFKEIQRKRSTQMNSSNSSGRLVLDRLNMTSFMLRPVGLGRGTVKTFFFPQVGAVVRLSLPSRSAHTEIYSYRVRRERRSYFLRWFYS
jgi:hypothetical protein